ncbi:hypothetical protein DVH05_017203 [Phytophthora capsici]|nr:hypothetical protein DVH05_017203 [Phytophthora capsici]
MHAALDESVHSRKRRRSSKKKRPRKKKLGSLETKVTEEDEISHDEHEKYITQDQTSDSDQEPSEEEQRQLTSQEHNTQAQPTVEEHDEDSSDDEVTDYESKRENILDLKSADKFSASTSTGFETEKETKQQLQAETPALRVKNEITPQTAQQTPNQDLSDEDDDEVFDYERKRRENILRNQAYLKSVGMSTAKFAARTSIGYEVKKEVKQELLAEKRAIRAAEKKIPLRTKVVNQSHDSSDEDDDETMDYERKRRENILRNQAYLKSVGMSTAKFAARTSIGNGVGAKKQLLADKQSLRAADEKVLQRTEIEEEDQSSSDESVEFEHKRRSSRIQKKITDRGRSRLRTHLRRDKVPDLRQQIDLGHPLDILYVKNMRQPVGSSLHVMDVADDEGKEFCKGLAGGLDTFKGMEPVDDVNYSLDDRDMVRALPYCTTAMAFLPQPNRIVVAAGDKEGHLALWTPSTGESDSTAALSRPHGYRVSHLIFPDSSTLVSSSIDGTVREFDFWTATTSPIGDLSSETGISSLIGSGNPQFYYAACEDGTLRLVDRRARKMFNAQYSLHKTRINSVDQHPSLEFCIATASWDSTVCLWDKRKISPQDNAPVARLLHKKSVSSAQFSPGDGSWLAAVGHGYFDMYDTSHLVTSNEFTIPKWVRIPHKTHTSAAHIVRPGWDPRRKDRLVIACLEKPARLQIFRAGQKQPIQELQNTKLSTVQPVDLMTVYHPNADIIASSNSSGTLSLWRAKPKE